MQALRRIAASASRAGYTFNKDQQLVIYESIGAETTCNLQVTGQKQLVIYKSTGQKQPVIYKPTRAETACNLQADRAETTCNLQVERAETTCNLLPDVG